MRGKTDEDIMAERQVALEAATELVKCDVELIDSFIYDDEPGDNAITYLGKSIIFLSKADIAYFAPGWNETRGCLIEYQVCQSYDIPTIEA